MAISKVVSIGAVLILAIALAIALSFRNTSFFLTPSISLFISFLLIHLSLTGFIVAVCSHPSINYTDLLKKKQDGSFSWWPYLFFYGYHCLVQASVKYKRLKRNEHVCDEICDGLFVGGWPMVAADVPPGSPAVIDCTCELPKTKCIEGLPYIYIPAWDSRCPSAESIESAVRWAIQQRSEKRPIFVHCASGHGRSVAVICALLIALGVVVTCQEAEDMVKRHRMVKMNNIQRKNLNHWKEKYGKHYC